MGGINDIRVAFSRYAKGIDLRNVRMSYDNINQQQVFEFDVVKDGEQQTIKESVPQSALTPDIINMALDVAERMGAQVERPKSMPASSLASMATLVGGDAPLLNPGEDEEEEETPGVEIEHHGETYQLSHDGAPQTLFF